MTDILIVLAVNFGLCLIAFLLVWLTGALISDITFIDAWWALGLIGLAVATAVQTGGPDARGWLMLVLVGLWGLRLGGYMLWRWRTAGPDPRYEKMIANDRSKSGRGYAAAALPLVLLQAPTQWIVGLPVQLGQFEPGLPLGALAWVGAALAVIGVVFEATGDWQMVRFKADPANKGKVMDRGLWRYTRHPNYFGDLCVWFGLWLIAAETAPGLFAIAGPLLLLVMFTRVSGGTLYEGKLSETRPGYADYLKRTSPLVPWPPRRG